jgi:MarR family transcriptional regulator, organic hydroperoxide resistance regulator
MAGDGLRLEDQLCFSLYAATRAMTAAYAPLLEALDLTYPQYLVMLVLWERDGSRVSDIGEQLYLDSGTLTPLIKRLESRKLVERRRSEGDERVVEIHLTAAGKRLRKQATTIPHAMFEKSCLSVPELIKLRYQLHQLTAKLRGPAV